MQICIFEDEKYINFEPLIYSRPVYELTCGISTLREKILRGFPKYKVSLHCRSYLQPVLQQQFPQVPVNRIEENECLFVNGRILSDKNLMKLFSTKSDKMFLCGDTIAAIKLSGTKFKKFRYIFTEFF